MKPNIVLFVCDDLRWDVLSGMNHPVVRTPNIDKLMQSGTTFTRCYIPGGSDKAVYMPSRAMLHTGRFLFNIDRAGEEIPADHTLIGEWLNGQGYDRFHTGKWHNERSYFNRSFNGGNEIFFGGMGDQWKLGKLGTGNLSAAFRRVVSINLSDYCSGQFTIGAEHSILE